jgi:hypothetical protein
MRIYAFCNELEEIALSERMYYISVVISVLKIAVLPLVGPSRS